MDDTEGWRMCPLFALPILFGGNTKDGRETIAAAVCDDGGKVDTTEDIMAFISAKLTADEAPEEEADDDDEIPEVNEEEEAGEINDDEACEDDNILILVFAFSNRFCCIVFSALLLSCDTITKISQEKK